jgi:hydroxymethylglutaryl-CoA synthase
MLEVRLQDIGSASAYRAVDFRKPVLRNLILGKLNCHFQDLPVFNGKYSTTCYLDETLYALHDMLERLRREPADYYRSLAAAFMHRPYHRMPESSFAMSYLFGLAHNGASGRAELGEHCRRANMDLGEVLDEMHSEPDILKLVKDKNIDADAYPLSVQLLKEFRNSETFGDLVAAKMSLGSEIMKDIGNVYCAALPAWMAAGMEEAARGARDLAGGEVLAVGYGSGDAAEAIPMVVAERWREAARLIGFGAALERAQDLTREQYEGLHDTGTAPGLHAPEEGFVIESIGSSSHPGFSDEGIEYYRFVG